MCPISLSTNLRIFASLLFINNTPSLASATDATKDFHDSPHDKNIAIRPIGRSSSGNPAYNNTQPLCFLLVALPGRTHPNGCSVPSQMHGNVLLYPNRLLRNPITDGPSFMFLLLPVTVHL